MRKVHAVVRAGELTTLCQTLAPVTCAAILPGEHKKPGDEDLDAVTCEECLMHLEALRERLLRPIMNSAS